MRVTIQTNSDSSNTSKSVQKKAQTTTPLAWKFSLTSHGQLVMSHHWLTNLMGRQCFWQVDISHRQAIGPAAVLQILTNLAVASPGVLEALLRAYWVSTPVRTDNVGLKFHLAVDTAGQGPPARARGQGNVVENGLARQDVASGNKVPEQGIELH